MYNQTHRGFTLVELLIVTVIVSILASVTAVAYNGIQKRALNAAIKANVASAAKLITAYQSGEGSDPLSDLSYPGACMTTDNDCSLTNGDKFVTDDSKSIRNDNPALMQQLRKYGSPPASVAHQGMTAYGVSYYLNSYETYQTRKNPLRILYWLKGSDEDCNGIGGMVSVQLQDVNTTFAPAKNSNGGSAIDGLTRCFMKFPN